MKKEILIKLLKTYDTGDGREIKGKGSFRKFFWDSPEVSRLRKVLQKQSIQKLPVNATLPEEDLAEIKKIIKSSQRRDGLTRQILDTLSLYQNNLWRERLVELISLTSAKTKVLFSMPADTNDLLITTTLDYEIQLIESSLKSLSIDYEFDSKKNSLTIFASESNWSKLQDKNFIAEYERNEGAMLADIIRYNQKDKIDFLKGRDCSFVYSKENGVWYSSISWVVICEQFELILELVKNNADPNAGSHFVPLQLQVRKIGSEGWSRDNKDHLQVLLDVGADVNKINWNGLNVLQESILMNARELGEYLMDQKAAIDWSDSSSLASLQNLYNYLENLIGNEYKKSNGKLFMPLIGEYHYHCFGRLIRTFILDIAKKFNIQYYCKEIIEPDQKSALSLYLNLDNIAAEFYQMKKVAIDLARTGVDENDITPEGIAYREKQMCMKLQELNQSCVVSVGANHMLPIAEDDELKKKYHILPITLPWPWANDLNKTTLDKEAYQEQHRLKFSDDPFKSKEVMEFLLEVKDFKQLHEKLLENKIITAGPKLSLTAGPILLGSSHKGNRRPELINSLFPFQFTLTRNEAGRIYNFSEMDLAKKIKDNIERMLKIAHSPMQIEMITMDSREIVLTLYNASEENLLAMEALGFGERSDFMATQAQGALTG